MKNLINIILNFIFLLREKHYKKKLSCVTKRRILSAESKGERIHITAGEKLTINSEVKEKKVKMNAEIKKILEERLPDSDAVFNYIESKGTKVYKINHADIILRLFGKKEGFVLPQKGMTAFLLNIILNKKVSFKTAEAFVLRNLPISSVILCYHFYKWFDYKENGSKISKSAQKFLNEQDLFFNEKNISKFSYEDIVALKSFVRSDIEAIDFVLDYTKEHENAKEIADIIKDGGSAQL